MAQLNERVHMECGYGVQSAPAKCLPPAVFLSGAEPHLKAMENGRNVGKRSVVMRGKRG